MLDLTRRQALCRVAVGLALAAGWTLAGAAPAGGVALAGARGAPLATSRFDLDIDAAAAHHGVDRELVRAVIEVESGFDERVVSRAGAQGLMQLMPATARRFGVADPFDARQNIFGGTRFLRVLLDAYAGDVTLSAAAYNAGQGAVARHGGLPPYRTTRAFVRRVQALLAARPARASLALHPPRVALGQRAPLQPAPAWPLAFLARPWPAWPPSGHGLEAGREGTQLASVRFGSTTGSPR